MAIGPISYTEIDAYCRTTHAALSAWDVRLIRRMDNAVLAIIAGQVPGGGSAQIPITDGRALSSLFQGLKAQKAKSRGNADE